MTHPQLVPATTTELLNDAHARLAEIERADGAAPISDQALLAVANGTRELFVITTASRAGDALGVGVIGEGEVDLALAPGARTPEFEGAALQLLLAQARGELKFWVHGDRPAASTALAAAGFSPARSLYRMALDPDLLPTDQNGPQALSMAAGVTLRAFGSAPGGSPDDASGVARRDAEAWVSANAAAFAHHPEQGRITLADFAGLRQEPWFNADDLLLLEVDGEIVGSTWIKTLRSDTSPTDTATNTTPTNTACELYAVGVRPEFAGKGFGKLLLQATLARMAEHAPNSVSLYVDGDNMAAVTLYERAGFTIDSRSLQWLRPDLGGPNARMGS